MQTQSCDDSIEKFSWIVFADDSKTAKTKSLEIEVLYTVLLSIHKSILYKLL